MLCTRIGMVLMHVLMCFMWEKTFGSQENIVLHTTTQLTFPSPRCGEMPLACIASIRTASIKQTREHRACISATHHNPIHPIHNPSFHNPIHPIHNPLVQQSTIKPMANPSKTRVVIIGAGIAGLSTANVLLKEASDDVDVCVLEGSNRVGGRCLSTSSPSNAHMGWEQGATWIHGIGPPDNPNPIYTLAQQYNLLPSTDTKPPQWRVPTVLAPHGRPLDSTMQRVVRVAYRAFSNAIEEAGELMEGSVVRVLQQAWQQVGGGVFIWCWFGVFGVVLRLRERVHHACLTIRTHHPIVPIVPITHPLTHTAPVTTPT